MIAKPQSSRLGSRSFETPIRAGDQLLSQLPDISSGQYREGSFSHHPAVSKELAKPSLANPYSNEANHSMHQSVNRTTTLP
jgi:hypothetical protein